MRYPTASAPVRRRDHGSKPAHRTSDLLPSAVNDPADQDCDHDDHTDVDDRRQPHVQRHEGEPSQTAAPRGEKEKTPTTPGTLWVDACDGNRIAGAAAIG
jgi:hypothetical protein